MGIPTLITTNTITSGTAASSFTSGIDSTYDEYMFVCTDVHPETDGASFQFQANAVGEADYNETMTTSWFYSRHNESDDTAELAYVVGNDLAQGTGFQRLAHEGSSQADSSVTGILHLFSPSNTTYVKHFYARFNYVSYNIGAYDSFIAGYFNTTAAIDEIQFKYSSGNIDNAVIQMYGIS